MSLINNNNNSVGNSTSLPLLQTLRTMAQELSSLLPQGQSNGLGGINMGPKTDTLSPSNNLFAGSLPNSANSDNPVSNKLAATAPSSTAPTNDFMPTSPSGGDPAVNGNTGGTSSANNSQNSPIGGTDSSPSGGNSSTIPSGGNSSPTGGSGSTTPSGGDSSSGSSSSYVDNMMKALKANGAPDSLLQAYQHQYQLLGLTGGSGSTPPSGSNDPAVGNSTPSSGSSDPTAGSGTPPTASNMPTGGDNTPSSGNNVPPLSNKAVTNGGGNTAPGGDSSTAPPSDNTSNSKPPAGGSTAPSGSSSTPSGGSTSSGSSSPEFSGSGKVDWNKAPADLKQLQPYIQKASAATNVPESIIAGAIWKETGGNIQGNSGGLGLMQIDPNTYKSELAGKNGLPASDTTPTDPATNIMAGATYLAQMKDKFGSWDLTLRGYNSGPNGVDPSDPNALPSHYGDANYVIQMKKIVPSLENGTLAS